MILSVSRRTDIPAFYSDWLLHRFAQGYALVRNPVNPHQISRIPLTPDVVDCIVFWSKNPLPLLPHLHHLHSYPYYFQFTLTAYGADIEPHVPPLHMLVETFCRLSSSVGPERVIWRYDPILINPASSAEFHISAFEWLAKRLHGAAHTCIISFLDSYSSIRSFLHDASVHPLCQEQMLQIAKPLQQIGQTYGFQLMACAEELDLRPIGILPAHCIDAGLISQLCGAPIHARKDTGQRTACGCIQSIDIGSYHTCPHGCRYCYANHSQTILKRNVSNYQNDSPLLCSTLQPNDTVHVRKVCSDKIHQLSLFDLK